MKEAIKVIQKAVLDRMQENAGPEVDGFKPLINFNKEDNDPYIIELKKAIQILESQS